MKQRTIEEQIAAIADKSELHRLIDSLPEGAKGVLLFRYEADGETWIESFQMGQCTQELGVYLATLFINRMTHRPSE